MRCAVALMLFASAGIFGQSTNVLNRIVTTTGAPGGGPLNPGAPPNGTLVFTDTDTMATTSFPLPNGLIAGNFVAMDRNGDAWLSDARTPYGFWKFNSSGVNTAVVYPPFAETYAITDQQANLIVGCEQYTPPKVWLFMYSPSGQLLRSLDIETLFPPGVFAPLFGTPNPFFGGVNRILVSRSGSLWLAVIGAGYNPVIKLNPDWTLAASYGLFSPGTILPDQDEGVWVCHVNNWSQPLNMPGAPIGGMIHLSSSGAILEIGPDGNCNAMATSLGQIRIDGRQFQYVSGGAGITAPTIILVHPETVTGFPWYIQSAFIPIPPGPLGYQDHMANFYLDTGQRIWALQTTSSLVNGTPANLYWRRFPSEPPYTNPTVGQLGRPFQWAAASGAWSWSSYWGQPTLHEYCLYTDPLGDLDLDGIPNQAELRNRTNPCVPNVQAMTIVPASAAPGAWITVDYTVPGDAGLPYFAPFAFSNVPTAVGSGYTIPFSLGDGLMLESLAPHWPWIQNGLGVLDASGHVQSRIQVPALPWLSGFAFGSVLLDWDPAGATLFKNVSPWIPLTVN